MKRVTIVDRIAWALVTEVTFIGGFKIPTTKDDNHEPVRSMLLRLNGDCKVSSKVNSTD